ncbi:MAG: hypothetical protein ABIZ52_03420 [Candidatus Limnocylindrales bacterium]
MIKHRRSIGLALGTLWVLSVGVGSVLARDNVPDYANCMGKDMGAWARELRSDWGHLVADEARGEAFGERNWGQAMVVHLRGGYFGEPGITCQP